MTVGLAACAGESAAPSSTSVRDTAVVRAGIEVPVRLVENPATPSSNALWTVSPEPVLDLGGPDVPEDEALFRVASAWRLADGRIVIGDGGEVTLKVFEPTGRLTARIGRSGDGPGEFRGINHVALLPGDSLAVWDLAQGRLTVFDANGVAGREARIGASETSRRSDIVGILEDGSILSRGFIRLAETPDGLMRPETQTWHLSPDGTLVDSIGPLPGGETWFIPRDGGFSVFTPPFARRTELLVSGGRILVGDTDRPEVRVLAADGTPQLLIRWQIQPRAITNDDIEGARNEALGEDPSESQRLDIDRMFARYDMPAAMPAFGRLSTDTGGNIWVQEYRTEWDEGEATWRVFDPDGSLIATAPLPGGFRPTHIGSDFILGIATDEFDVEHVRLYGLDR